ncbi:MAG TPA: hypothetical protein VFO16_21810 [Pseudonocardiaceae bacterium]|nr:hypothetical protein [Pseudonocardiaceae bacterium]
MRSSSIACCDLDRRIRQLPGDPGLPGTAAPGLRDDRSWHRERDSADRRMLDQAADTLVGRRRYDARGGWAPVTRRHQAGRRRQRPAMR